MAIKISHLDKLFTCFPLTVKYRHLLADDKTYLYFKDYWFLLRYTVIIYKFTQGNLGAKKIARGGFQSPVKKKIRKLRHWRPTVRSLCTNIVYLFNIYIYWEVSLVDRTNVSSFDFQFSTKSWQPFYLFPE